MVQVEVSVFLHDSIFLATIIGPGLAFTQVEPITAGQTTGDVDRAADGPIIALPWDFWTWGSSCWVPSFRGVENAGPREMLVPEKHADLQKVREGMEYLGCPQILGLMALKARGDNCPSLFGNVDQLSPPLA